MFEHLIEKSVRSAVDSLPYGTIPSTCYTTRGHVWKPQDAVFVEAEIVFGNGDKLVLTPHDGENVIAEFVLTGPEGETLDQGTMAREIDIVDAVIGFAAMLV